MKDLSNILLEKLKINKDSKVDKLPSDIAEALSYIGIYQDNLDKFKGIDKIIDFFEEHLPKKNLIIQPFVHINAHEDIIQEYGIRPKFAKELSKSSSEDFNKKYWDILKKHTDALELKDDNLIFYFKSNQILVTIPQGEPGKRMIYARHSIIIFF